ncbi:hypothetical protein POM88_049747 [Heracleum sosnowskyi]|uniref:BED-type domain-containing protein n=1 Tax=Heracleum sosnowskyi TaxID=360622 RepID=A0AAD8M0U4_9APIA|nr:hypothetical protein POM88_049747 [Heracleum sosnowskyi]
MVDGDRRGSEVEDGEAGSGGNVLSSTPCASSSSIGMISTQCVENVSKNSDMDCILLAHEDDLAAKSAQEKEQPTKRKKTFKSEAWNHFDRIESMIKGNASSSTPCASSSSVGMISTQCAENVSKSSDMDCIILAQENDLAVKSTQEKEQPAKIKKPFKSEAWNHFDRIESVIKGTKKVDAICKYCRTTFNGASDQGTTNLKNHTKTCRMRLIKVLVSQMLLGKQVSNSYAYKGMYDIRADLHVDDIREFLVQIFNEYSENFGSNRGFVENSW